MEIVFNIKDLLEKNNQVSLPGLGSFYTKRIEGFFDETKNTFFPPKETIAFTTSEASTEAWQNDSILEFISHSKNVSAASAAYILSKYTDELRKDLEEKGEVHFQDIGKLKQENSQLIFLADKEKVVGNAFFGLPSFSLHKEFQQDTLLSERVLLPANFSLAEQALSASVPDKVRPKERKSRSNVWLYVLLSLMIVALSVSALYISSPYIFSPLLDFNKEEAKPVEPIVTPEEREKEIADSIYHNDIARNLEASGFEVESVKDTANISVAKKIVPNANSIRYEIIIAAWKTRTKAELHLKKLKENGIDAHIVEDAEDSYFKISAATLYNQEDANKELKRIKKELNPEALIKPIRP